MPTPDNHDEPASAGIRIIVLVDIRADSTIVLDVCALLDQSPYRVEVSHPDRSWRRRARRPERSMAKWRKGMMMAGGDTEELRIALVMNGGVSLAVWIGGVVREMTRLVSGAAAYRDIIDFIGYEPRIDVIAGTSAGGVNGAFLAMALTHLSAAQLDGAMERLRTLWINDGAIDQLLRNPFAADPPSLLDGDGFYYQALRGAFEEIGSMSKGQPPTAQSLDLILTATLLRGKAQNQADDFGTSVADTTHRSRFLFSRSSEKDDFTAPRIAEKLAVAARSTSSFPAAFEPSFCPVGEDAQGKPDMLGLIDIDRSRFLIDGGVLDNKPLDVALDRIFKQKAQKPARRVLAYVIPDPGQPGRDDVADDFAVTPELLSVVMSSLVDIPSVQSVGGQLQQLRDHNQRVRSQRRTRTLITRHIDPKAIDLIAGRLFQSYRDERLERALSTIIDGLNEGLSQAPQFRTLGLRGRKSLLHDLIFNMRDDIPWIPRFAPLALCAASERSSTNWRWGTTIIGQLARVALDLLVRLEKHCVATGGGASSRWADMSNLLAQADKLLSGEKDYWVRKAGEFVAQFGSDETAGSGAASFTRWFQTELKTWRGPRRKDAGELAEALAAFVDKLAADFAQSPMSQQAPRTGGRPDEVEDLRKLFAYLAPRRGHATLPRLLAFLVIQETLGDDSPVREEEEIEFIQLSGNDDEQMAAAGAAVAQPGTVTSNVTPPVRPVAAKPVLGPPVVRRASDKLNGTQLAHFGAFYKSSWRANDWLWGRRDAVARILRVLLSPERLRKIAHRLALESNPRAAPAASRALVLERLETIVSNFAPISGHPDDADYFASLWSDSKDLIRDELDYLDDTDAIAPESLPALTRLLNECIVSDILRSELPLLADAIDLDVQNHMGSSPNAQTIRQKCLISSRSQSSSIDPLSCKAANALADASNLGGETWKDEARTDPATAVVAQAFAVSIAAAKGDHGLAAVAGKPLTILRIPSLLFYNFAQSLSKRSLFGVALTAILLGSSLTILTIAAWQQDLSLVPFGKWGGAVATAIAVGTIFIFTNRVRAGWLRVLLGVGVGVAAVGAMWWIYQDIKPIEPQTKKWIEIAFGEAALILAALATSAMSLGFKVRMAVAQWRFRRRWATKGTR